MKFLALYQTSDLVYSWFAHFFGGLPDSQPIHVGVLALLTHIYGEVRERRHHLDFGAHRHDARNGMQMAAYPHIWGTILETRLKMSEL